MSALSTRLYLTQSAARESLTERFADRGTTASEFAETYVSQLFARQGAVALDSLSGEQPSSAFHAAVGAFGFQSALLLDADGRVLDAQPRSPVQPGTDPAHTYTYLSTALQGRPVVSTVVPGPDGPAVVAFAVPFETPRGRRVLSGAFQVNDTPLDVFFDNLLTAPRSHVYLVDDNGIVVASDHGNAGEFQSLTERDPDLAAARAKQQSGFYRTASGRYYFVAHRVTGTPWSLLIATPAARLFAPVSGASQWVPWLSLAGLGLLAVIAAWMTCSLVESRRRLRRTNELLVTANASLEQVVRLDELTGLSNRRHLSEQLGRILAGASRYGFPVSILVIDIDHFKRLNDTYGHQTGDAVLRHVADILGGTVRAADLLGRWGGEEFLAVLPHTDLDGAVGVAMRQREAMAATTLEVVSQGADVTVTVTVSIGVAQYAGENADELLHRADVALYEAKASGRNAVRSAPDLTARVESHTLLTS